MLRFALKSKKVLLPGGLQPGIVLVAGAVIEAVTDYNTRTDCCIHDVGEKIIMPGVIDPHVHINEPGRTDWEGFETATKAAIAGGLTTIVDMPLNSSPVTTSALAFDQKIAAAKKSLHTNCGFWGGIVPANSHEIEPLIAKGVLGFKAFLTHSGIDDFPNVTEKDLRIAMPVIAKYGLPLLVHCELESEKGFKLSYDKSSNATSYRNYLASRPERWEDDAIALMIRLCGEFNCRVHIVHLSSADSIQQISEAKQRGLPISAETGQHYLFFNAEDIGDAQTQFKCAPPIRGKENNDRLWGALQSGVIDFVATDHSPAPPDLKQLQSGDFMKAWGGISSLQFALPALWTAARRKGISIEHLATWLCENPAKLIGREKSKGKITPGFDADLIVWDPDASFRVSESLIHHRHKITPYLGEDLYGIVEETYIAGKIVFSSGEFTALNCGNLILNE